MSGAVVVWGSRVIASKENCLPTLTLTLAQTQTLALTGGNFPQGWLSGYCRLEVFCEKGVLRNLAIFTEKHLCRSLFLDKDY